VNARLNEHLETILTRRQGEDVRRREANLPVWDLGRPGLFARNRRDRLDAVTGCRAELLAALLGSGGPVYLSHGEPPESYEIPGTWTPAGPSTWLVPRDFDPRHPKARHWLFALGGWNLYTAPAPTSEGWPDVFRCRAGDLLAWMATHSVRDLIVSFWDDTDWVVATSSPEAQ
jgi:hypothetical protein